MTVGSLFAGIGGFDLGFERAGFDVRWQVEQDGKAQSVLSRRFAGATLHDDVRTVGAHNLEPVDVICGGFPCQDVSIAGKREGLIGDRTGLFSEVVRIARELLPCGLQWVVLENVPGLLSSHAGRDFYTVLSALADLGFRRAYRILDSRYFGVAQRRRRVFIVLRARGCSHGPETVLFESTGGGWDSSTSDEAGARVAATLRGRSHGVGVNAPGRGGEDDQNLVTAFDWQTQGSSRTRPHCGSGYTSTLEAGKRDAVMIAGPLGGGNDGAGRRSEDDPNLVYGVSVHGNQRGREVFATLNSGGNAGGFRTEPGEHLVATALSASMGHHGHSSPRGDGSDNLIAHCLTGTMHKRHDDDTDTLIAATLAQHMRGQTDCVTDNLQRSGSGVRRLTPLECERLQGFPDGWTCLCGAGWQGSIYCECADSPRYKQLGNAVTVPVAEWIARRILEAEGV